MEAARAAVNGGIAVLEIVRSTPGVFEVLQALANEYPTKAFGVGTVLTAQDAKTAMKAGAKFLMSPATDILDDVRDTDVLYMPGVMTPTEIYSAHNAGAKIVKGAISVVLSDAIFDKEAMNQNNFDVVNRLATSAAVQGKIAVESAAFALACSKSYVRTYISSIFHFLKEEKIKHDRKGILTERTGKAELFFPMPMSFMCLISEAETFLLGSVEASDTCSTRNTILI
ncbi:KHG/KDPG aldolase [Gossypium arboreum]|uniref:KHG/KDPG aldolase n=1 Tax=Gossypium arboreum TaxID=29729 RepID=A0A0B0MNM4_GOSAR|nr:KHG/KDPG aldolase [Gossypium arboreum]